MHRPRGLHSNIPFLCFLQIEKDGRGNFKFLHDPEVFSDERSMLSFTATQSEAHCTDATRNRGWPL